jgi:hypothetical protein
VDRTLSWLAGAHNPDATERTLAEIDAAIAMVSLGIAATVRLVNLPEAEATAFEAAARAQAAGLAFRLQRQDAGSTTLIVGPRFVASVGDATHGDHG